MTINKMISAAMTTIIAASGPTIAPMLPADTKVVHGQCLINWCGVIMCIAIDQNNSMKKEWIRN